MAYKQFAPLPVDEGGTGDLTLTLHGVVIGETTSALGTTAAGLNGQVLLGSNSANPAFGTLTSAGGTIAFTTGPASLNLEVSGVGVVTSITGTTNEITASASTGAVTLSIPSTFIAPGSIQATTSVTADTSFNLPYTSSSTIGVINMGGVPWMHAYNGSTDDGGNVFIGIDSGSPAGNFTLTTAALNIGIGGNSLHSLTTGSLNCCLGYSAGVSLTSGQSNVFIGDESGGNTTTSSYSTAVGADSLIDQTTGGNNSALGNSTLYQLRTGSFNVAIGTINGSSASSGTGFSYTTSESNNILVQNVGVIGESNVMRLGTSGSGTQQVNKCFIAGIYNTSIGGTNQLVSVDSTGQLGFVSGAGAVSSVTGTTNQITASPTTGAVVLSTPVVFIAPGSSAAVTTVGAGTNFLMPTTTSTAGQIIQNGVTVFHAYGTNNIFLGQMLVTLP